MILRQSLFIPKSSICHQCRRLLHQSLPTPPVPKPIPFVPDVPSFLTVIGRGLSAHASKIPSWEALFTYNSDQLKEIGIEPPRNRKYLLRWRNKFQKGEFGMGGDLEHVQDGVAELRLLEVPAHPGSKSKYDRMGTATKTPGMVKVVVNVPNGSEKPDEPLKQVKPVKGVKIKGARTICGPWVQPMKGTGKLGATLKVQEGIWEHRRGHKVDGGERRKAEVRAKRSAAERKAAEGR